MLYIDIRNALDIETKNIQANTETENNEIVKKEGIYCDICDTTFKNNEEYGLHSIKHTNDNIYKCHVCKHASIIKGKFKLHMRRHDGYSYKCEICKKPFVVASHAYEHVNFHTGEKPFKCDICKMCFMFSRELSAHKKKEHWEIGTGMPKKKYDCLTCKKQYKSHGGLLQHNQSKHSVKKKERPDRSVLCDICGKRFFSKYTLKSHKITHSGVTPQQIFDCLVCKKQFNTTSGLRRHNLNKHKGEKPDTSVLCDICGKRLCDPHTLKLHKRKHTGDKPFKCQFCNKCFSERRYLVGHERVHTKEKPYICKYCNKGFSLNCSLRTHERIHTGKRPYNCRLCKKGYMSLGPLRGHENNCLGPS